MPQPSAPSPDAGYGTNTSGGATWGTDGAPGFQLFPSDQLGLSAD